MLSSWQPLYNIPYIPHDTRLVDDGSMHLSVPLKRHSGPLVGRWQAYYLSLVVAANSWQTAVIAMEIYRLIRCSKKLIRYKTSSIQQVLRKSLLVYVFAALVAGMSLYPISWTPLDVDAQFYWLFFQMISIGIPVIIVAWIFFDSIWSNKLLPPRRGSEEDYRCFFFFRIIFVIVIMWGPSLLVLFALRGPLSPRATWGFGL